MVFFKINFRALCPFHHKHRNKIPGSSVPKTVNIAVLHLIISSHSTWIRFDEDWSGRYELEYNGLTLILLMWRIWWAPNNASKWQVGFNSAFKGLNESGFKMCEEKNYCKELKKRKAISYIQWKEGEANWIGHILRRNCLLKHVIIEGKMEVTERRGKRGKQLWYDLRETRGYWKLK